MKKFLALAVLAWGAVTMVTGLDEEKQRAECEMWSKVENKVLPLQNQGHANCTTNEECTGFSCIGLYQVRRQERRGKFSGQPRPAILKVEFPFP